MFLASVRYPCNFMKNHPCCLNPKLNKTPHVSFLFHSWSVAAITPELQPQSSSGPGCLFTQALPDLGRPLLSAGPPLPLVLVFLRMFTQFLLASGVSELFLLFLSLGFCPSDASHPHENLPHPFAWPPLGQGLPPREPLHNHLVPFPHICPLPWRNEEQPPCSPPLRMPSPRRWRLQEGRPGDSCCWCHSSLAFLFGVRPFSAH